MNIPAEFLKGQDLNKIQLLLDHIAAELKSSLRAKMSRYDRAIDPDVSSGIGIALEDTLDLFKAISIQFLDQKYSYQVMVKGRALLAQLISTDITLYTSVRQNAADQSAIDSVQNMSPEAVVEELGKWGYRYNEDTKRWER